MPHWPRWLNYLYAKAFGYFWLECRACGRTFGGHECARWSPIPGWASCWRCEAWLPEKYSLTIDVGQRMVGNQTTAQIADYLRYVYSWKLTKETPNMLSFDEWVKK